jgi:hypothetical protein
MTFETAEKIMHQQCVGKTAFQSFPSDTLEKLCKKYALPVIAIGRRLKGSTIKIDYINAIMIFVSQCARSH